MELTKGCVCVHSFEWAKDIGDLIDVPMGFHPNPTEAKGKIRLDLAIAGEGQGGEKGKRAITNGLGPVCVNV